jgi:uncharacterized protein (DUF1697 family)
LLRAIVRDSGTIRDVSEYTQQLMGVVICMLRGVNVGAHNRLKMEDLRAMCAWMKLRHAQTYVQSGNVVFRTDERDVAKLTRNIEDAIEKKFGFRCDVICRTTAEMKRVVARNPFAKRVGIEPGKLHVTFFGTDPGEPGRAKVRGIQADPEELFMERRECYIHFPNGAGRSKLAWSEIPKMLEVTGTARNWNSVMKMLEMAEKMESAK